MRILIADTDLSLLSLVRRTLEAEGHRVRVANTKEALDVAAADGQVDVALLDAQLASDATASADQIRAAGAHIFVTTPLSDGHDNIRGLRERLGGADYLRKPFSVLDLPIELARVARAKGTTSRRPAGFGSGDLLGRMAARGAAGPLRGMRPPIERANRSLMPKMGGPVVFPVAERLAGAWLERFTGSVRIRATTALGRPLNLREGGLTDPRDTSLVDVALRGAELQFVAGSLDNGRPGDRTRFIQTIWTAVYKASEVRFAEVRAFEALRLTRHGSLEELGALVGADTYRVLQLADGARALGEIIVQALTTPTTVSADFLALHRLGLINFAPPATRPVDRRRAAPTGPAPEPDSTVASRRTSARRTSNIRREPRKPTSSSRRSTSSRTKRTSARRADHTSGQAHVAATMRRAGSADAVHRRLGLEIGRLEGASPAEVLGIPNDSNRQLVAEVGGRMLQRYADIAENTRYPEETRELGRTLVAKVEHAVARWGHDQSRAVGDPTTQREAVMYEQGMVLIEAADFARADRVFTAARDLAMANPKILAGLGWARFNNPDRDKDERQEEGRDYLMLAEQFDATDPVTEWYLCKVLLKLDDKPGALRRAKRVLAADPAHAEAKATVAELSAKDEPKPAR